MIELGLHTGIRVDEMVKLRHQDLFLDNGRSSLRVLGKGSKIRPIWLSSKFLRICSKFYELKSLFGFSTSGDSFLLNALDGGQISRRALQKFFVQIAQKALPRRKCSIHSLRHTYTTELLRSSGHNYRFAQRQLGHASLRTTQVYAGIVEADARQALEKMYRKPRRQNQE